MNATVAGNKLKACCLACMLSLLAAAGGWAAPSKTAELKLRWEHLDENKDLKGVSISVICPADRSVYIGTGRGLFVFDRGSQRVTAYGSSAGLPAEAVLSLATDGARLWIGTVKGLALLEADAVTPVPAVTAAVQAVMANGASVFLGTPQGLLEYRPEQRTVAPVEGFQNCQVTRLQRIGPYLFVIANRTEVTALNLETRSRMPFELEFNPLQNRVTAVAGQGDFLWFATEGSGLIGYDVMHHEWISRRLPSHAAAIFEALGTQGKYLWAGGFSGLIRYELSRDQWLDISTGVLRNQTLTTLAVDGSWVWLGTSDNGVFRGNTHVPAIQSRLIRRYFGSETANWQGEVRGEGRLSRRIEYRSAAVSRWAQTWASVRGSRNIYHGRLDLRALPDGEYQVRVTVRDKSGHANEEQFSVVRETRPLRLNFAATSLRSGRITIAGEYFPDSVEGIVIRPGEVQATLNPDDRTFTGEIMLTQPDTICCIVRDRIGRTRECIYQPRFSETPKVRILAASGVFTPGADPAQFAVEQNGLGEVGRWALEVTTPANKIVWRQTGEGKPPQALTWDGNDENGRPVGAGQIFLYTLRLVEKSGLKIFTPQQVLKSAEIASVKREPSAVLVGQSILFDSGKEALKPCFRSVFDEIRRVLADHPDALFHVEGHADDRPVYEPYYTNQYLSEARALRVLNYLTTQCGVDKHAVTYAGYGSSRPLAPNKSWANRYRNRRVEIYWVKK